MYKKGEAFFKNGNLNEAISCYDKTIGIDPSFVKAFSSKGWALTLLDKHQDAISCYDKALELEPKNVNFLNSKASALSTLGKPEEAILCYESALLIEPNDVAALYSKATILEAIGRSEESKICYNKALELNPEFFLDHGRALTLGGEYKKAIYWFDRIIQGNPNNVSAYLNKALAVGSLGDKAQSLTLLDKALEIGTNDRNLFKKNKTLILKGGPRQEVFTKGIEYGDILERRPLDFQIYFHKGLALIDLGRIEGAIRCFDKAIDIDPMYADSYVQKGICFSKLEKINEALVYFDEALD